MVNAAVKLACFVLEKRIQHEDETVVLFPGLKHRRRVEVPHGSAGGVLEGLHAHHSGFN